LANQLRPGTHIGLLAIALFELRYGHARSDKRAESDRLPAEYPAPGIQS
jgi:tRNA(fMet)-specific endonuclease VapC